MKKNNSLFHVSRLSFLVSFMFLFAIPSHAFDLLNFLFPPVQIEESERRAPDPALAPEVPSDNTYSNTLENETITCSGNASADNSWSKEDHKTEVTLLDSEGNPYTETQYQDYNAENLDGEVDLKNLSNEYYRNFQSFFARGSIKCTEEKAKNSFLSLEMNGSSASLRSLPTNQIYYYRSLFLTEAAQSLNNSQQFDTVTQDYQIAWDCRGTCVEMSQDKSKLDSACRPIYLTEIIFGLQNEALYYSSPTANPEFFPAELLTPVLSHYSGNCGNYGCYSDRSEGKAFVPLTKEDYLLFYKQLNYVPKGNVNSRVTVTNYNGYDTASETPTNPVDEVYNRTLPNAAAAYSPHSTSLSFVNPSQQKPLENSDLCENSTVSPLTSRDSPQPNTITTFVKGLIKHVLAGFDFSKSVPIPVSTTYDKKVVDNVKISEQAFSNMIPSKSLEEKKLLEVKFSSKTPANDEPNVVDPGFRSDLLYQEMRSLLRPSSW
ncbi:MAG TPA: hypothetical protein PK045_01185 [Candidatus Woesebacteria bacterium]|nr:hypothetical protein [Candidatus Woesebacteria bacterium]